MPKLHDSVKETLLEEYAPELRFYKDERFFPMNVRDYIGACPSIYRNSTRLLKTSQPGRFIRWLKGDVFSNRKTMPAGRTVAENTSNRLNQDWEHKSVDERIEFLAKEGRSAEYNLHFLPEHPFWGWYFPKIILFVLLSFLVLAIVYGIHGLSDSYPKDLTLDGWDWVKVIILALSIVVWPFVDADSKVHSGIVLNIFCAFFFGTIFAVGFGLLAFALMATFWCIYAVFKAGHGLETHYPKLMNFLGRWKIPAVHGICLGLLVLSGGLIGLLIEIALDTPPGIPVIFASAVFLFYLLMWIAPGAISNPPGELYNIILLLIAAGLVGGVFGLGQQSAWNPDSAYVAIVSISGVTLLWYALHPLPVADRWKVKGSKRKLVSKSKTSWVKPARDKRKSLLQPRSGRVWQRQVKQQAIPRLRTRWSWRGLLIATLAIAVYLGLSIVFALRFDPQQPDMVVTVVFFHLVVILIGVLSTIVILGTRVAGYLLDIFSGLYNTDADQAWRRYKETVDRQTPDGKDPYWCYGQVVQKGNWVLLHYNFFYAFNDFRSTAGGMNNHEGDWESVSVFLRQNLLDKDHPYKPFGVAYSQHHHGDFRFWKYAKKAVVDGIETSHPVAYVAWGSHANYPTAGASPASMQLKGFVRTLADGIEKIIHFFHTEKWMKSSGPSASSAYDWHKGNNKLRIGINPPWNIEIISDDTAWVRYRGLWGRASSIGGEGGPQGPKWGGTKPRLRWGIELLGVLLLDLVHDEGKSIGLRLQALRELVGKDSL